MHLVLKLLIIQLHRLLYCIYSTCEIGGTMQITSASVIVGFLVYSVLKL